MNDQIISIFKGLRRYYEIENDIWRVKAYREAIDVLESLEYDIDGTHKLPGIGKRSMDKINKIINGATLEDFISQDGIQKLHAYEQLVNVRDIGPKKAKKLIAEYNIKDIKDLKKKVKASKIKLTKSQLIGLKYYDDLIRQIPRKEIQYVEKLAKRVARDIDKKLKVLILGSYRRKKMCSNDIDMLLYHPQIKTQKDLRKGVSYLKDFIDNLNIITAKLKTGSLRVTPRMKSINLEYLIKVKKYHRKVDIKFYPYDAHITAIVYFTGSRRFNRFMREKYRRNGYLLNQYGLYKNKKKIPINNEKELFSLIDLPYLPPHKRN